MPLSSSARGLRTSARRSLACLIVLTALPAVTAAQGWKPERNVEIVVGSAASGGNDATARFIQRIVKKHALVASPVTVVNKPGGGGSIAWAYVAQHSGDGHYLGIGSPTLLTNHIIGTSTLTYTDLTPLAHLFTDYTALSVKEGGALKSGQDVVQQLKRDPGAVAIGLANSLGNNNHIAVALVAKALGVDVKKLKVVVFQSTGEAITALMGGHIGMVSSPLSSAVPSMQARRTRTIALSGPQRLGGVLADVPTWKELGVNVDSGSFRLLLGPKGMTRPQIAYWDEVLSKLVQSEDWKKSLQPLYSTSTYLDAEASARDLKGEYQRLSAILGELGLAKR